MSVSGPIRSDESRGARPVFISYATADRKEALAVCKAIEHRGVVCWISTRDVAPGENYQEAIVRSLRDACAMVLVFSDAANNSDEIKKELSLASRYHIPVMALRIEDVEPSDAFAYELSTRQWIDAFEGWDRSIDSLVSTIRQMPTMATNGATSVRPPQQRVRMRSTWRTIALATATGIVLAGGVGAWRTLRPVPAAAHTMLVRLSGFERLSPDLPATLPQAMADEMVSAFTTDGVVGVSTAASPPSGTAPAYALGGTVRRDGDKIKFIAKITDERSGLTLWSKPYSFNASDLTRIPRWAAVQASWVARCGLFAVSTYPKLLPDQTLGKYFEFCGEDSPTKSLDIAKQIVAATPDFSWGWSAVEISALEALPNEQDRQPQFRQIGLHAAAEATRLDPSNSEAYAYENYLIDASDMVRREQLVKQGISSRPLACGCEHHFYGNIMMEVGRIDDAVVEYRRAVDILPLNGSSQLMLAEALVVDRKPEQSKDHFDAVIDMVDDPSERDQITVMTSPLTGNYSGVDQAMADQKLQFPAATRDAVTKAFRALQNHDGVDRAAAVVALSALPITKGGRLAVTLLGALGANAEALRRIDALGYLPGVRIWLWYPSMAGVLRDPSFPAVAQRLGLIGYWKTTHTKPDVCSSRAPPSVCRMI